jgi:YegS/Rv2252/BmrU family lipid kinase
MPRKILFIVNPNAGKKMSEVIIGIIRKEFPQNIYYQIAVWKNKEHFDEIIGLLKTGDYTDAVAVGGDGTVNYVARSILHTGIALGIVPVGSGNGLARTLGLSMQVEEVIKQIVVGDTLEIDSGTVNGTPFFCTSGVGFDAHIGGLFADSLRRGLRSYINITMRELFRYRAQNYKVTFNGKTIERKAFLITVANAGQYGNDFYIAPQADLRDGLFHLVILKPFNILKVAGLLRHILGRKAFLAKSIETHSSDHIVIERESAAGIHFDGEPGKGPEKLEYIMHRRSLKVIVGKNFIVA